MGTESIFFGDGKTVTGIIHLSTTDAVFRTLDGKPITMEYNPYCGPQFFDKDEDPYWPEDDTPESINLWRQYFGWWDAKGKFIYSKP